MQSVCEIKVMLAPVSGLPPYASGKTTVLSPSGVAVAKKVKPAAQHSGGSTGVFEAFRTNKAFQDMIRDTVLDVLRSPEGQEILSRVVKKELKK